MRSQSTASRSPKPARPGDDIAKQVKSWERQHDTRLPLDQIVVARMDGTAFGTYTCGLRRPFDDRFTQSMVHTTADLVEKFSAPLGFTCSDEITLVLRLPPPSTAPQQPPAPLFNNRVQKLASVLAAYTTARFNLHMASCDWSDLGPSTQATIAQQSACFDARVFGVPSVQDAVLCVYWRHKFDCFRNAVTAYASHEFGDQAIHGLSTQALIHKLVEEAGFDVRTQAPEAVLYGTFAKREQYEVPGRNPVTGQAVVARRTRVHTRCFDWDLVMPGQAAKEALVTNRLWPCDGEPSAAPGGC